MIKTAQRHVKQGKNLLAEAREAARLSKTAAAALLLTYRKRLATYETSAEPPEIIRIVLAMEQAYNAPGLPERYCAEMCLIGKRCKRNIEIRDLTRAILGILAGCTNLEVMKTRLVEIAADGVIDRKERPDFERIVSELSRLADTIEALRLWALTNLDAGKEVAA